MNVNIFIFISLVIDLLAFTLILPLLPSLLECFSKYDNVIINFLLKLILIFDFSRVDCIFTLITLLFPARIGLVHHKCLTDVKNFIFLNFIQ